ncbi:Pyrimidine-specific ribonucleoside hydrolase RihA [Ceratocystis lukuohia]|uniref:Pyrimidine-specific ribonucleoside hydrolase RihA n=1 Tax=Ceratocystis lukuohia TaxID=2019550 RepID=A0ABR4MST2_9PEZI
MAPHKIIIDTDPGVDDILALLLAMAAKPEEIELIMVSVTYGNVPLTSCLKNAVALFHVLEKEFAWRRSVGRAEGYESLKACKPILAVGPDHPLEEESLMADYFHGLDGLHGVHEKHPDLSPADTWKDLFKGGAEAASENNHLFTPSKVPAHKELLRLLRENPVDSITLLTVGPMTTAALAAGEDPETFLKLKEVVVMGGAVHVPGNITPVAEFNTYADTIAAARVLALTSAKPASTMPVLPNELSKLPPYPESLPRKLNLALFPLDITTPHLLMRDTFDAAIKRQLEAGSPLAIWINHFLSKTLDHIESLVGPDEIPGLSLHDPLTVWYMITHNDPGWKTTPKPEDIRVETTGQWTRGMNVIDKRGRKRAEDVTLTPATSTAPAIMAEEIPNDDNGWLSAVRGNRVNRYISSPGEMAFAPFMLERIFG